MNAVKPFMSQEDITAGARWSGEIATALDQTSVGIVCVTRSNQKAPWLNFEAGAIAKRVGDDTRLIPLAIDLSDTDVETPLGQFQAKEASRNGIWDVVIAINSALPDPVAETQLRGVYDLVWPELQQIIEDAQTPPRGAVPRPRSDRELLEDVLTTVRHMAATDARSVPRRSNQVRRPKSSRQVRAQEVLLSTAERCLGPSYDCSTHWTEDGVLHLHTSKPIPRDVETTILEHVGPFEVPVEILGPRVLPAAKPPSRQMPKEISTSSPRARRPGPRPAN